jgi:serine protease AprX
MKKKQILCSILICLSLLLGTGISKTQGIPQTRIHPLLVDMADKNPYQEVSVIVVAENSMNAVEKIVKRLGGETTKKLGIINALTVQIPSGKALELSRYPEVRWISPDVSIDQTDCPDCIDTGNLKSVYLETIGATRLWNEAPYMQGQNERVAYADSGFFPHVDLREMNNPSSPLRIKGVNFSHAPSILDLYGHGTHIAGLIAGNGNGSDGSYMGVAPQAYLQSVKVCGGLGACFTSDVIEGLQWINEHGHNLGIRVVNISINSAVQESYLTNPLCAALEILWFNGYVVVVSAGNRAESALYPPANDPFLITVGATDDHGTPLIEDDTMAVFSAYGTTTDGFTKPDLVAPGVNMVSLMNSKTSILALQHPDHRLPEYTAPLGGYFNMSGTSMSSAIVSGAIALLLQDEPDLNPDQVKFRLMATAAKADRWPGYDPYRAGAGYLDIYSAVHANTFETANTGVLFSRLIVLGPGVTNWGSVNWGSVNWGSVNWGSVNWGSVNWGSVNWGSDYWGPKVK